MYSLHTPYGIKSIIGNKYFLPKIVVITLNVLLWHVHWICYNKVILKEENEILTAHFDKISFYLLSNTTYKHSAKLSLVILIILWPF